VKFTVNVTTLESRPNPSRWEVSVNGHHLGSVIHSPAPADDEKNAYRDWIIDSPSDTTGRFTTLDDAAWRLIRSVVNFETGTLQQRRVVDLNLAEKEGDDPNSGGSGGNCQIYSAEDPDPNPYTGPHKWARHTAGHPWAECRVCGAEQVSPGPGEPDPPPERTPSGLWYAPHEPPTCEPKRVTVGRIGGSAGSREEVKKVLTQAGYTVVWG